MAFRRLDKKLTFFDVYAISTGAMFSSGFFLLPGIAFAEAGHAVVLAYLCAGLLIIPAMLSVAELSTAMPRAGGAYFFLDRALGPVAGTIGGLGTWMAMILKTAFAFVGVGAYLRLFLDVPITAVAIALTLAFTAVNIVGAKETSGLQRVLVGALVGILTVFVVAGLIEIITSGGGPGGSIGEVVGSMTEVDSAAFLATIGMVFVSYAGLTKVASVAEEVRAPGRAIPRGMTHSLLSATGIYVIGVLVMVVVIEPSALRGDLTPVATAGQVVLDWLPAGYIALGLIVIAALAAFLSTGNAGIMSASRYLLAMGRDSLVPGRLATIGRFGTPTIGIVITSAVVVLCVATLDVANLAKLASAFQLLMFSLINLAVIVMRESRIVGYDPSYRAPLYPWLQIAGAVIPLVLIGELGHLAILFTAAVVAMCVAWYVWYARHRVRRAGALLHWFARMGHQRFPGLESELRTILQERDGEAVDDLIANAPQVEVPDGTDFNQVVKLAAALLADAAGVPRASLAQQFVDGTRTGETPVARHVALPHLRLPGLSEPHVVMIHARPGATIAVPRNDAEVAHIRSFYFLISAAEDPARHLRLLAGIARWVERTGPSM
ncbi:MAG: APC family permease [Proteobacteria bacterium]|nr:APC family permease [Pseudomonadota bacterium]